jgi:hypothetical protein
MRRTRAVVAVLALAATSARHASAQCTFSNEIDPYTQYNDLNGDSAAQSSDQCKSNCCSDANCQVWQWSDDPMTPPNCWSGNSNDYGDSGGVEWQGEQGKGGPAPAPAPGPGPAPAPGPGPAPAPAPAPGGGGIAPGAKCIGVHCTSDEAESNWGMLFCWSLAGLCSVYMAAGIYSNVNAGKSGAELVSLPPKSPRSAVRAWFVPHPALASPPSTPRVRSHRFRTQRSGRVWVAW